VNVFTNYSYQWEPTVEGFPLSETNLPPNHRFNAGFNFGYRRFLGNMSVNYTDQAFYRFFMAELLPLVPAAHHEWNYGDILKTDYLFNTQCRSDGVLWHVPNERGGITVMRPEDY